MFALSWLSSRAEPRPAQSCRFVVDPPWLSISLYLSKWISCRATAAQEIEECDYVQNAVLLAGESTLKSSDRARTASNHLSFQVLEYILAIDRDQRIEQNINWMNGSSSTV